MAFVAGLAGRPGRTTEHEGACRRTEASLSDVLTPAASTRPKPEHDGHRVASAHRAAASAPENAAESGRAQCSRCDDCKQSKPLPAVRSRCSTGEIRRGVRRCRARFSDRRSLHTAEFGRRAPRSLEWPNGHGQRPARRDALVGPGAGVSGARRTGRVRAPRRESFARFAGRGGDREDGATGVSRPNRGGPEHRTCNGHRVGDGVGLRQPASAVHAAARPTRATARATTRRAPNRLRPDRRTSSGPISGRARFAQPALRRGRATCPALRRGRRAMVGSDVGADARLRRSAVVGRVGGSRVRRRASPARSSSMCRRSRCGAS